MCTFCTFCFTPIGERYCEYECIIKNKKYNLEVAVCPECDYFYDFYPKTLKGDNKEDIVQELNVAINENKIKETFCYICSNHYGIHTNLNWENDKIELRMCNECIDKLPESEDKFEVKGCTYEEAIIFIKRSLLF